MTRSTGRAARVIVALAIGLAPVACDRASRPTTAPAASRLPSPAAPGSHGPISTPAPPPAGLAEWQQLPPQSELDGGLLNSVVFAEGRFFGLGCVATAEGCELPAIWESEDGLAWQAAGPVTVPPNATRGRIVTVSSSRFGTVAAGSVGLGDVSEASIWLRDGGRWALITPQSAADASVSALLATEGRIIAVGSGSEVFMHFAGFRAWWSADGTTWRAAPAVVHDAGGNPTDLLLVDGALLAWGPGCGELCPPVPSAWWLSVDGTAWQPVDPPRGLEGVDLSVVDRTPSGLVAFGSTAFADPPLLSEAWAADETGADWRPVEPPRAPIETHVRHHLIVGQGAVAAAGGLIWLRGPGEATWRAPVAIPDLQIFALIQSPAQPNRVIVFGQTFEGYEMHLEIWTGVVDWAT